MLSFTVAAEVARRSHRLQSSLLRTKLCAINTIDAAPAATLTTDLERKKLLLRDIPQDVREELLQYYIQTHTKVAVISLQIHNEGRSALAELEESYGSCRSQPHLT